MIQQFYSFGIQPKKGRIVTQTDIRISTFIVALFMRAKRQKQPKGPDKCKDEKNVEHKRSIFNHIKEWSSDIW